MPPLRPLSAALTGASGALVMLWMLGPDPGGGWPFLLAAFVGAALSGWVLAVWLAHPDPRRWLGAVILATGLGAALAGFGLGLAVGAGPGGVILGPYAVGRALVTSPLTLLLWLASMGATRLVLKRAAHRP